MMGTSLWVCFERLVARLTCLELTTSRHNLWRYGCEWFAALCSVSRAQARCGSMTNMMNSLGYENVRESRVRLQLNSNEMALYTQLLLTDG